MYEGKVLTRTMVRVYYGRGKQYKFKVDSVSYLETVFKRELDASEEMRALMQ